MGRVRRADHRHSAAERRYSGAHDGQDELPDAVRHVGGIDDRSAGAGLRQRPASTSGAAALSYATVYPLAMFLRIMSPQLLAVLFWTL